MVANSKCICSWSEVSFFSCVDSVNETFVANVLLANGNQTILVTHSAWPMAAKLRQFLFLTIP